MNSLISSLVPRAIVLAGLFLSGACLAQTYTQTLTNLFANGTNQPDKSATVTPNDPLTFSNAVRQAHATNYGGVFDFPTTVTTGTTTYRGNYGGGAKRVILTSSVSMQNSTAGGNTFYPVSPPNLTTSSGNQSSYSLAIGAPLDAVSGLPLPNEGVASIGFVVLSRTAAAYPMDVRGTATFSDGSTQAATATVGNPRGTDDTFFGFTAPGDLTITNLQLQSFTVGTTTPVADRIGLDDVGFVTKPTNIPPPPVIYSVTPLNYAISAAGNGIHFQVQSFLSLDPTNISLVLNSADVSSQLVVTGPATNRLVAFAGLAANQTYTMTITARNLGGQSAVTQTFYTATNAFTLYDSQGFTNDTLYPPGNLQAVTDGQATWAPNALEPAQIVDVGPPQDRVLQRLNTGLSRADFLNFPPLSSGTLIIEFDAWVSNPLWRTMDLSLMPLGGATTTMASFLAWGEAAGKLAYYDNVNWLPLADLPGDWHHCKIINYLSGPSAGRYDVVVNGLVVAQRLPWRNAAVGTAFSRFRIQSQNTGPVFEYGNLDNLVILGAPEDANAFPPPLLIPISPVADRSIIRASAGLRFGVVSQAPLATANIGAVLDGEDVSGSLSFTGPATNLTVTCPGVSAETNHVTALGATNSAGATTVTFNFIATEQPWLYDPSEGWTGPWQYSSGMPQLLTDNPLAASVPYVRLDTTGGARNLVRPYAPSASVDISQPHFIRWKFRLAETDFAFNFATFNDRVHFFARNAARPTGSTDAADSWAISATGAEQTPGSGISAGQRFCIFDNRDGTGAYNLANLVDSQIQLFPDNVYSFEVLVFPQSQSYSVAITNETTGTWFKSAAPHLFRAAGVTATSHTVLHFGTQANTTTVLRPFDLGPVSLASAVAPWVTLANPVHAGNVFSFSFQSRPGIIHVAKFSADVASGSWTSLATNVGNGTVMTVNHTNPPPGRLFYRVESSLP